MHGNILKNTGIKNIKKLNQTVDFNNIFYNEPTLVICPAFNVSNKQVVNEQIKETDLIINMFKECLGYNKCFLRFGFYKHLDNNLKRFYYKNIPIIDYYFKKNLLILNFEIKKGDPGYLTRSVVKKYALFLKEIIGDNEIKNSLTQQEIINMTYAKTLNQFSKNLDLQIKQDENSIVTSINNIESRNREIITSYATINASERRLESLLNFKLNFKNILIKSINEIKELHFVKNIKIEDRGLIIDVGEIYLSYNEIKNVFIGNFEILICPDKILFYNNKSKLDLQHPHINHNNPCLDTFHKEVYKLLGEIRLKELVFLLYRFLKTYTDSGAYSGSKLSEWKKFRDTQNKTKTNINNI